MSTKNTNNLKVIDSNQPEPQHTDWEKEKEDLKITRQEVQLRVEALRTKLEAYRDQLDAAPFDILNDEEPRSLQQKRKFTIDLVENLNPLVAGLSKSIEEDKSVDVDSLFDLKLWAAETGFKIGVLAGVILADSDTKTVAKFARGLAFDLSCHRELIKD